MFSSNQPLLANQLPISSDFSPSEGDIPDTLQNLYRRIANVVNTKEGAFYSKQEISNFQQYFSTVNTFPGTGLNAFYFRNGYRKVFDLIELNVGNIVPGALVSFFHNISGIQVCTRIYGTATTTDATPLFLPLPYAGQPSNTSISIWADTTKIYLQNGTGQTALSQAYIVLEYLKQQ